MSEIGFFGNRSFQCSFITSTKLLTVHWDIISSKAKLGMFHSIYTLIKMQTTNIVSLRKLWFHIICIPNNIVLLWYLVLHLLCLWSHLVVYPYVYHILCHLRCVYIILVRCVKKVVCVYHFSMFIECTRYVFYNSCGCILFKGSSAPGVEQRLSLWGEGGQERQTGGLHQCCPRTHQSVWQVSSERENWDAMGN